MTLQQMLQQFKSHGVSPAAVAKLLQRGGLSVSYTTIHRVYHGNETTYSVGKAIERLHEQILSSKTNGKPRKSTATSTRASTSA